MPKLHPVRFALCAAALALLLPPLTAQAQPAGATCQGQPVTNGCKVNGAVGPCKGTSGNDVIVGTPGPDVIHARGGHDKVLGRGGADIICGGGGEDLVFGGSGADSIEGNGGDDDLRGEGGPDTIDGGGGSGDVVNGGNGNDACLDPGFATFWQCEFLDGDGDGFAENEDCDDSDPDVNPDAAEECNGIDDDCDGDTDEDITLASDAATRFEDRVLTVFDCATHLEWEKKLAATAPSCIGGSPHVRCVDNTYTWGDGSDLDPTGTAFTVFLPGLDNFAGIPACTTTSVCEAPFPLTPPVTCTTDPPDGCWRLPEVDELLTILTAEFPDCTSSPCITPVFGPTAESNYWSATSLGFQDLVWTVFFSIVSGPAEANNPDTFHVRAVRSGP